MFEASGKIMHSRQTGPSAAVGLVLLLLAAAPAATVAQTTADSVVGKPTLKMFVEDAKRHIESITNYNEFLGLRETLRERGTWVSGETYLILAQANGSVPFHAGERSAESRNILGMRDDRGVEVVRKMIEVADSGGGFVDYVDGELKTSYATKLLTGVGSITFYLIGGYSQDLSTAPPATVDLPRPAVTAAEVVDRETLVAFVEAAAAVYRRAYESKTHGDVMAIRKRLPRGGRTLEGRVGLSLDGGQRGHHPSSRHRAVPGRQADRHGTRGLERPSLSPSCSFGGALREGRKFLRYYYDNPEIVGDEGNRLPQVRIRRELQRAELGPEGRRRFGDLRPHRRVTARLLRRPRAWRFHEGCDHRFRGGAFSQLYGARGPSGGTGVRRARGGAAQTMARAGRAGAQAGRRQRGARGVAQVGEPAAGRGSSAPSCGSRARERRASHQAADEAGPGRGGPEVHTGSTSPGGGKLDGRREEQTLDDRGAGEHPAADQLAGAAPLAQMGEQGLRGWWLGASRWTRRSSPRGRIAKTVRPGITGVGPVKLRNVEHGRMGAQRMTQWAARDRRR